MAQIIKHRRGSLEALSAVTSSLQKGEIIIASGSSNLTVTNGSSLVFAVPENGQVQATNRFLIGDSAPNTFAGSTYNGMVKGVPYYASGSSTLYLLGTDGNDIINLVGNIQPFSTSVDSRLDSIETSLGGGGGIGTRVSTLESHSIAVNAFTASQEAKDVIISAYTASMNTFSASVEGHITDINTKTGSFETKFTTLGTYTASVNGHISDINTYTSSLRTAFTASGANVTFSGNVTIPGNLTVTGTQTIVDSTTVQIGDNIIELNGSSAANGGLYVKDVTNPNTATGSILWDSTNDYWKAGVKDAESKIALMGGDNLVTASAQILFDQINGYSTYSSSVATSISSSDARELQLSTSVDSRLDSIETSLGGGGSIGARVSALETFSGSQEAKDVIISAYTASMNTFTASVEGHIADINTKTGSFEGKFTTLSSYTASMNTFTASQEAKDVIISAYTASMNTFTGSTYVTFSQSVDSRLDTLEGTGTIQGVGTTNDVTFNKVTTAGDVIVGGDLVVQGNTVTLNTATLVVEDKLISLASGSTNAATANGAGIEVLGANATFTYDSTPNAWTANIPISASAVTASVNIPGFGSSKRMAFRSTTGNLDFVAAPTIAGDIPQWDGTNFVMSNVIDGGTY